ncbi:SbcC/MukB-like Walker B domain-containing protein [Peribacillus sp. SCS-26]|uniref:SbcC/MukB-like Walker B domain-containing protein n=1 Tax=Paraperibacillus marinus TaxID=3115295 RepID=UPI0039062B97
MKPLKLTMQAFGPYAKKEEIDFAELGSRTMFVISGKTGAGKTTIFDGLSFAIYGKASGEDRSGNELRSQFAEDDVLTEVALEFSLRGKFYYISRSPQQERKKKSGEGTTTAGAKAELYEIKDNGERELLGANVRDVDEKIKIIMGLDANQFRQILMIPQGEFRKLLTSESKDKEVILQRLFHTEIYKQIEEKLREEATSLKKQAEANQNERKGLIRDIRPSLAENLQQEMNSEEPNELRILSLLAEEITLSGNALATLAKKEQDKQSERDKIQKNIHQAEELLLKMKERDSLIKKKEELEGKKPEADKIRKTILLAGKAAQLEKQEEYYLKAGRSVKHTEEEAERLKSQKQKLALALKEAESLHEAELSKGAEREAASARVHELQRLQASVAAFSGLLQETEKLKNKLMLVKDHKQKTEQRAEELEREEEAFYKQKEESDKAALLFSEKERAFEKHKHVLTELDKIKRSTADAKAAEQKLAQSEQILKQQSEELRQAKERLEHLEELWRKSHAGILAATLEDGTPCAVCGSTHHPAPAAALEGLPKEEEITAAKELFTAAELKKSQGEGAFYGASSAYEAAAKILEERIATLKESIPHFEGEGLQDLQQQLMMEAAELTKILTGLEHQKGMLPTIIANIARVKEERNAVREKLKSYSSEEERSRKDFMDTEAKLQNMKASVPESIRTEKAFQAELSSASHQLKKLQIALEKSAERLQAARQEHSTVEALLASTTQRHQELKTELEEERSRFQEDMKTQGFMKYGDYTSAKKTADELKRLEDALAAYEQQYNQVTGLLDDLNMKLAGMEVPDIDSLKETFRAVSLELDELRNESRQILMGLEENRRIEQKLSNMLSQQKELDEKYKVIGHLYEVSRGQNPFRITFERYVLAAFLDDILAQANGRLGKMTGGRYQLIRKVDPTRRNIQSGLELSVYDQYTGQERHVKTLSGGESFKAALALALGLADVVQQYSGGVSLETMFIDEGFGTLDPESLDNAVEALVDIQSSGRLVGVISHVPELKERIDVCLEVSSTQAGSYTEFKFTN